jgi:hypothetical protein
VARIAEHVEVVPCDPPQGLNGFHAVVSAAEAAGWTPAAAIVAAPLMRVVEVTAIVASRGATSDFVAHYSCNTFHPLAKRTHKTQSATSHSSTHRLSGRGGQCGGFEHCDERII